MILDKGASFSFGERDIQWAVRNEDQLMWLAPPNSLGEITVADIHTSASVTDHGLQVRSWAESAWMAWAEHHGTVQAWAARILKT